MTDEVSKSTKAITSAFQQSWRDKFVGANQRPSPSPADKKTIAALMGKDRRA